MTRARDVANVLSTATDLATDAETAALIATEVSNRNAAIAAVPARGNTASRPESPTVGDLYANTQTGNLETYTSLGWSQIGVLPAAPTSLVATNSPSGRAYNNGSASVAFSAGTGGLPSSYTITSSPGSYTATGSTSPITITGLQSSTQYTYTGTASNNYGTSSASSASTGVTATTVPQAPTIGTATGADQSATLTFTAGATGGSAITNYKYSTDSSTYTIFDPPQTSSPLTISGLSNDQSYSFYLKAVNSNGDSAASAASNSSLIGIFGDYESISTLTVGAGGASSLTFSSIPQTYTHLQIRGMSRSARSAGNDPIYMRFNSDTGNNYAWHQLEGAGGGSAGQASNSSTNVAWLWIAADSVSPANVFGANITDILNYTNTNQYKTARNLGGVDNNGSGGVFGFNSALWMSTSAITSITLTVLSGTNFQQNTQFALYGIKGVA